MTVAAPLNRLTEMSALKEVCRDIAGSLHIDQSYWHFSNFNNVPHMCIDFSWGTGFTIEQLKVLTTSFDGHITGILACSGELRIYLARH